MADARVTRRAAMAAFGADERGHPLSAAEIHERSIAGAASARARRHPSESAPSVRQGSTGLPSRSAISLFRQGQQRTDARGGRAVWDTRSTEHGAGSINASFTLHLPEAVKSKPPVVAPPARGRPLLAQALAAKKTGEPQDLVVKNPATFVEAQRHPLMREIIANTIGVVREHQKGAIEQGQIRGLIPEGTRPGLVARAYKHAALMAIHKVGLGDYDFRMDDAAKAELRPLIPFMRYAHRRVFDKLNVANKGRWEPFKSEFGQLYRQKKHGKLTGAERMRMRPSNEFIKLDLGDLSDGALAKSWTNASGVIRAPTSPTERESPRREAPPDHLLPTTSHRVVDQHQHQPLGARIRNDHKASTPIPARKKNNQNGHDTRSLTRLGRVAAARAEAAHSPHGHTLRRLGALRSVPAPAPGKPPPATPNQHVMQAAQDVEAHFGVPPIGGASNDVSRGSRGESDADQNALPMAKQDLSFLLGRPVPPTIGGYNTNPDLQLKRAIHPRLRQHHFRLRLNTQKDLRRVLSGGISRQERWQLGATTKQPTSYLGKRLIDERLARLAARRDPDHIERAAQNARPPTVAQAKAGNYRMGHARLGDMRVSIETPRGKLRQGIGPGGRRWKVRMPAHYGYIGNTKGADGDHLDVYLGPHAHEAERHPVFIVNQHDANTGSFDEHKIMAGFVDRDHAAATYDLAFSDKRGPERRKAMHQVTFGELRQWVGSKKTRRPYAPLAKGIIGDALEYGATHLGQIGATAGNLAGMAGEAIAASRPAQAIAGAVRQVAGTRAGQAVLGNSRVQAGLGELRNTGLTGLLAPAHAVGRGVGAAVGGATGAKWGGRVGLVADYAPDALFYGMAARRLIGGAPQPAQPTAAPPGTLTQQGVADVLGIRTGAAPSQPLPGAQPSQPLPGARLRRPRNLAQPLGKSIASSALRVAGAGARRFGSLGTRTKTTLALTGGVLAAGPADRATKDHPGVRAALGAAAGAGVVALGRGRALNAVRRSTRSIYTEGLREATREHLRVLHGGSPSPSHIAQQHMVFRAMRQRALHEAKTKRAAGIAAVGSRRGRMAAASIAGASAGALSGYRNRWSTLSDPGNPQ